MSIRTVFVSAILLVCCGAVTSQPQPTPPGGPVVPPLYTPPTAPPVRAPAAVPPPAVPDPRLDFSPLAPPVFVKPTPPPEKTVEDLLNELERVQAEKAELEKKEQELKATVRKKLELQAERLKKLGVAPKDAKQPDRVGQIFIEGAAAKEEKKILDSLGMTPGQVLHYPALEGARAKLEKAGFQDVTVEVLHGDLDPTFKNIRVRVTEPKPEPAPVPMARG